LGEGNTEPRRITAALLCSVRSLLAVPFKSKRRLEGEGAALRHQLTILRRQVRGRVQVPNFIGRSWRNSIAVARWSFGLSFNQMIGPH